MDSNINLASCLPADLQGPDTTITRMAAGLSGAGVYRVEANGQTFVLKISNANDALDGWRHKLYVQQLAADAGLAPRIIHVDEEQRAIMSAFVVDKSFPVFFGTPDTREKALVQLGQTVRRVHELPLRLKGEVKSPREFIAPLWTDLVANFALPAFVKDTVSRVLAETLPAGERPLVLSHNDINPTNLVYDGENILLLDWETAGPNDPFFDLAAVSVFFRMDEETCRKLLAAYDGEPVSNLPARFVYSQRLVAAMCGTIFLTLARYGGHTGATGDETLDSTPSLFDFYQQLRVGAVNPATADGQWYFGLALIKASTTFKESQ